MSSALLSLAGSRYRRGGGDPLADPYVVPFTDNVARIAEMTKGALNVLDNDPQGFVAMIEAGGAVDAACHDGYPLSQLSQRPTRGTKSHRLRPGGLVADSPVRPTVGRQALLRRARSLTLLHRLGELTSRPTGQTAMQTPHTPPSPSCLSVSRSQALTS